jgi:hypothetical protein
VLIALLLLATLPKLAIILAPTDSLYSTSGLHSGLPYHGEEIHRGTTAVELLNGPILPLQDYHFAPFYGGSLVVSFLAAPLFALFGSSIAVLRLTGLVVTALMVLFLYLALVRVAGRRVAAVAGLLAALPAPGYTVLSVTAFGSHLESNAFAMFLFYAFVRCWWEPASGRARWRLAFFAGAVAGFATYFGYIILLTIAALFVAGWLRDRRFPLRLETRAALAGYLLGFLPWLTYNLPRGFPGLSIYGRELFAGSEAASATRSAGGRMLDLGLRYLPDSAAFRDLGVLSGHAMGLFYAWQRGGVCHQYRCPPSQRRLVGCGLRPPRCRHALPLRLFDRCGPNRNRDHGGESGSPPCRALATAAGRFRDLRGSRVIAVGQED